MRHEDARGGPAASLGPIFSGWAHLLLRAAQRHRLKRLYFVARDGHFLQQVAERLLAALGRDGEFDLRYLYLSRRATQLAAYPDVGGAEIAEAMAVRAGEFTVGSLLAYHGLTPESSAPIVKAMGHSLDTPLFSAEDGAALLGRTLVRDFLRAESHRQRDAVVAYLRQSHVLDRSDSALIDIGWRGSIQRNLARILADVHGPAAPPWLYFGLWRDDGQARQLPESSEGLVGDIRRGRRLAESAPWQAAFLLEALCRNNEGTVLRFQAEGATVTPVLETADRPSREAELRSHETAESVRQAILDFVSSRGADHAWARSDDSALRASIQRQLLRVAFAPTAAEIALGENLVHTESHEPCWSSSLVQPHAHSLLLAPRRWVAGLASPWRGAYVMASGGPLLATAYRTFEHLLLLLPPSVRDTLRRTAIRAAKIPPSVR